jgi:hypothetical protein
VEILPPDEPWAGLTRGEWGARWWQWLWSMPEAVNPNFDTTGERCGYGQSGPVFLLPGAWGDADEPEITCVVSEGAAIYVQVAGATCSTVEPPPFFGRTEDVLRTCATAHADSIDVQIRVDGRDVADMDAYRTSSPLFTATFPENNILGVEPGVTQAVSEDYSIIIAPPSAGEYEIAYTGSYAGEPFIPMTATIVVESPQVIETPPSSSTAP